MWRRWGTKTEAVRARLLARRRRDGRTYTRQDLQGLPAPVVRYFTRALTDGQPLVVHARIEWAGTFNLGRPGNDRWAPFTAVQDFVPGAPGMVWDARIAMAPAVPMRVRDGFVDGEGSMYGALLGFFPIVNKAGTPEMAVASLQRYLAEGTWFPTALLPVEGVAWTPMDEDRARATLTVGRVTASVEFRFDADGRPVSAFVPDRLYDDGRAPPSRHPWEGTNLSFTTVDGMLIPSEATVAWLLPEGRYAYWQGRPVRVVYEYAADRRATA